MHSAQPLSSSSDATTYLKKRLELEERNPNGSQRIVFWRDRPIHALAKNFFSRLFASNSTLTHWALQIGEDYVWELEIVQGKMGLHVGFWRVPKKEGAPFVGTQRDGDPKNHKSTRGQEIGRTCMTDLEIHAKAEQVVRDMNSGKGRSWIDKLMQFYSPLHPVRNFKRLSPRWRRKHRYDEGNNNCQHFAQQLATALVPKNELKKTRTARTMVSLARILVNGAQVRN